MKKNKIIHLINEKLEKKSMINSAYHLILNVSGHMRLVVQF